MFSLSRTLFVVLCLTTIGVKSSFAQAAPTVSISATQVGNPALAGTLSVTVGWAANTPPGTSVEIMLSQCTLIMGIPTYSVPIALKRGQTFQCGPFGGRTTRVFMNLPPGMLMWPEVRLIGPAPGLANLGYAQCFPLPVP